MKTMPFIEKLHHWAKNSGSHPAVIVGAQQLNYQELAANAQLVAPGHSSERLAVVDSSSPLQLALNFCTAIGGNETAMVLDSSWPQQVRTQLVEAARNWDLAATAKGRPFLLGLSSGTSGLPKAFMRHSASWQESFVASADYFQLTQDTITFAPGPLAASMNLYALGESIHSGGTFVGLESFSPDAALDALAVNRATRLVLVPTILELLARRGMDTGRRAPELAFIVCAGSALTPATEALAREWAPNALIQHYYGAAELGFVTAMTFGPTGEHEAGSTVQGRASSDGDRGVGTAFPGARLTIRDSTGNEVGTGEIGSVCVQSPYVCAGYAWGDDGKAFSTLGTEDWFTVHDQGFLDDSGVLHLAGRASDMILSSGANVYPHAVESALRGNCGTGVDGRTLVDVVVTGIPDPVRGQRVVAAYLQAKRAEPATEPNSALSNLPNAVPTSLPAALRTAVAQLPLSHRPARYYELRELPLTGSGKLSRALLTQWIEEADPRVTRRN